MKPSMALKPLVFAIAAVMAVAVQADNGRRHHQNNNYKPKVVHTYATAEANDKQRSTGNFIRNEGTVNEAEMSDSAEGAAGNVGVNVAAGNGNQQDNAAAIANAGSDVSEIDNAFVFGHADATAQVRQYSNDNKVINYSTQNSAVMSGSGNGGDGNMGINIAGGDLNQQKNTMAIANSNAPLGNATATASADQNGPGLTVINGADRTYRVDTLSFTKTSSGEFSRSKSSELSVDKSASSSWSANSDKSFSVSGDRSSASSGSNSSSASGSNNSAASGSNSNSLSVDTSATLAASLGIDVSADASAETNTTRTVTNTFGPFEFSRSRSVDRSASASLDASLDASVDASIETSLDASRESSFDRSRESSFDRSRESAYDKSRESSFAVSGEKSSSKSGDKASESSYDKSKSFSETSSYDLSNTVSWQVLTPTGWANPVTNTATLSGSVNGGSGNLGVNVAAGVGNQQSNSLAISNQSF
ncbi:hypothetical protein D3C76_303470 [compost metagenome]